VNIGNTDLFFGKEKLGLPKETYYIFDSLVFARNEINICGLKAAVFSRKAKLFGVSKSFALCRFARMEVKYTS